MSDNLYRRGGVWWGRIKSAGREHRRSLRTRNKTEAKKRIEAWRESLSHARFHGEARHRYKELYLKWKLEYLPKSVKPATAKRYLVSARQLDPHLSPLYVDEISKRKIAGIISARMKEGATNATIRRDLTALSTMLTNAIGWGWIEDNAAKTFDRSIIRERRRVIKPPSDDAIEAFAVKAGEASKNLGQLVRFLRQSGMREEEAASLEWPEIDLSRAAAQLHETKTSRPRSVPLSANALGTLRGTERHENSDFVFWHGNGERYQNVASRLAYLKRKHGFRFRVHDLRHKFAIEHLRDGGDIYELSRTLGHTSVKTTEIYLGYVPGTKSGTMAAVSE